MLYKDHQSALQHAPVFDVNTVLSAEGPIQWWRDCIKHHTRGMRVIVSTNKRYYPDSGETRWPPSPMNISVFFSGDTLLDRTDLFSIFLELRLFPLQRD